MTDNAHSTTGPTNTRHRRQHRRCHSLFISVILYSLSGCGGSSSSVATAPPVTGSVVTDYIQFNLQQSTPIMTLTETSSWQDLTPLGNAIGKRRLVQLGESSHGSGSTNQLKTRIIKYLHQQHQFNVIAFESSTFACGRQFEQNTALLANELLSSCLFGIWQTHEVLELFRYIKQTQQTDNPLRLAGFDVQVSSFSENSASQATFFQRALPHINATLRQEVIHAANDAYALHQLMNQCLDNDNSACQQIKNRHAAHKAELQRLQNAIAGQTTYLGVLAELTLLSYEHAIDMRLSIAERTGRIFHPRDLGMATMATALAERLFPQDRIMLWAHNMHVAEDFPTQSLRNTNERVMGMWLADRWKDDLFTIGFYLSSGEQANNDRQVFPMSANSPDGVEGIFAATFQQDNRGRARLLVLPKQNQAGRGDDWLHQPISNKVWSSTENSSIMAQSYDAIIVIRDAQAPRYL
jgi:erythromycin esterase